MCPPPAQPFLSRTFIWLAGAATAAQLCAAEIRVSPGKDTLQAAIDQAQDGDVLTLGSGVFSKPVVVGKKLTLRGEEGATLDPSEPCGLNWEPAGDAMPGVYRAPASKPPRGLLQDGKFIAQLDEKRAGKSGDWHWETLLAKGPPLSGFQYIRALWIYRSKEQRVYARFAEGASPDKLQLSILWSKESAIVVDGAGGVVIEDITIAHAFEGLEITNGATDCQVRKCVVGPFERNGISISDGASGNLVENNEVFRGALEDWAPGENNKPRYEVWQIHKDVGFYDRVGISLFRAGEGNRILGNRVHHTFDGINIGDYTVESLDVPLVDPRHGARTEIARNVIEETRDSGMELGVGCIEVDVHHNILRRTHGGLRFKVPRIGPVYIHHNLLEEGSPFNIWFSMDHSPAEGYIYHNTIIGGQAGLTYSSFSKKDRGIGAPHWHLLNNLVITRDGFFSDRKTSTPVNFSADHNVVVGGGRPWPEGEAGKQDAHSLYLEGKYDRADDVSRARERAVGAGLDLSSYREGKPLPGCEPGYFTGSAPDAGAGKIE